jgi:hypothetical protein
MAHVQQGDVSRFAARVCGGVDTLEQAFGERRIVDSPPGGIQFTVQFAEGPDGPVDDVAVA